MIDTFKLLEQLPDFLWYNTKFTFKYIYQKIYGLEVDKYEPPKLVSFVWPKSDYSIAGKNKEYHTPHVTSRDIDKDKRVKTKFSKVIELRKCLDSDHAQRDRIKKIVVKNNNNHRLLE